MDQISVATKTTLALLVIATFGLPQPAGSANHTVQMTSSYSFVPDYLQIQLGDTVTWLNRDLDETHNSASRDGFWDTGDLSYNETGSYTFLFAGTFPYIDSFWYPLGMTGTIVVNGAAPAPPPPQLTNPSRLPNGTFQFTVTNLVVGATNILQFSTDLSHWTNFYTNVASAASYPYTDNAAPAFTRRFYRAYVLP